MEEANDAPHPRRLQEFLALSDQDLETYLGLEGLTLHLPNMPQRAWQESESWQQFFGFDGLAPDQYLGTGSYSDGPPPRQVAYLAGVANTDDIQEHLLALGYQTCATDQGAFYAIRHDLEQDLADPAARIASSSMNRVILGEDFLFPAPDSSTVTQGLEVAAGETPAMFDDPAVAAVADALGDPLSAALLTRPLALLEESSATIEPTPPVWRPKPENWGNLHQWELLGLGYGIEDQQRGWRFVLYYPEPGAAEADVAELGRRIQGYQFSMVPSLAGHLLTGGVCQSLDFQSVNSETGSTLTIQCDLAGNATMRAWWAVLEFRDIGFLLP